MYLKALQHVVATNYRFYTAYIVFFVAGLFLQLTLIQNDISLYVNSYHNPLLDLLFSNITGLGDFIFALAVVVIIFLFRRPYWLNALVCFSIPSIVTQLLKHFVYADHYRPAMVMKSYTQLHFVEGVAINELNSFPSGHATTAFAVFTFLAVMTGNKRFQVWFLVVAMLTGFSRIYLLQHFFEDVLAGSFIGMMGATMLYPLFTRTMMKGESTLS